MLAQTWGVNKVHTDASWRGTQEWRSRAAHVDISDTVVLSAELVRERVQRTHGARVALRAGKDGAQPIAQFAVG